jgi:hypothetical protein
MCDCCLTPNKQFVSNIYHTRCGHANHYTIHAFFVMQLFPKAYALAESNPDFDIDHINF